MQIKCLLLLALVPLIACVDVKSVQSKADAKAEVALKTESAISKKAVEKESANSKKAVEAEATISKKAVEKEKPAEETKNLQVQSAVGSAESDEKKRNYDTQYLQPSYSKPVYNQYAQADYTAKPVYNAQPAYPAKPSYVKPSYTQSTYDKPSYNKPVYNEKPVYNDKPYNAQPYNDKPYNAQPYNAQPAYPQQPYNAYHGNNYRDTLLQTNIISRLGDRTPFWLPRNDYYKEKDFPLGLNQLVNVGKERLVNYGRVLRQRYYNLLYNIKLTQIVAEASPDRVNIESALCILAGLAPPYGSQVWSSYDALATKWQPIAVNSVEFARSWKLNNNAPCKTAELVENVTITEVPELKHFLAENHAVIKRLEVLTGEDFTNELSWIWTANVIDTHNSEQEYFGAKFYPSRWADPKTLAVLKRANELKFSVWGADQAYLKLRGGLLMASVAENLANAANGNDSVKVALYSTNDFNVALCEHILDCFEGGQPGYGASLIIELHRGEGSYGNEPIVAVFKVDVVNNNRITQVNLGNSRRFAKLCYNSPTCSLSNFLLSLDGYLLGINEVEAKCNNN